MMSAINSPSISGDSGISGFADGSDIATRTDYAKRVVGRLGAFEFAGVLTLRNQNERGEA